jgi:hypothetical protein
MRVGQSGEGEAECRLPARRRAALACKLGVQLDARAQQQEVAFERGQSEFLGGAFESCRRIDRRALDRGATGTGAIATQPALRDDVAEFRERGVQIRLVRDGPVSRGCSGHGIVSFGPTGAPL